VDLVIPYSIASGSWDKAIAQRYIREGYEELLKALEGEGGLKVATKFGRGEKGKEEIWVFVGATSEKVDELVEREK
jgi:anoctamin-10